MRSCTPSLVVAISHWLLLPSRRYRNDYYLRIVFMMCVYYLCAAGMNVLSGTQARNRSVRPACSLPAHTPRHCCRPVSI